MSEKRKRERDGEKGKRTKKERERRVNQKILHHLQHLNNSVVWKSFLRSFPSPASSSFRFSLSLSLSLASSSFGSLCQREREREGKNVLEANFLKRGSLGDRDTESRIGTKDEDARERERERKGGRAKDDAF